MCEQLTHHACTCMIYLLMSQKPANNTEVLWSLRPSALPDYLEQIYKFKTQETDYSRNPCTALTHTVKLLKKNNEQLFRESCVISLVMLTLTSTILRVTQAAFHFYSHPQTSPTALSEMGHQLNLGATLVFVGDFSFSFFFWTRLLMFNGRKDNTRRQQRPCPTMKEPIGKDNGATMTSSLGTFSVITATSTGQTHKRQQALSKFRYLFTSTCSPLARRSGCSVSVRLTCETGHVSLCLCKQSSASPVCSNCRVTHTHTHSIIFII